MAGTATRNLDAALASLLGRLDPITAAEQQFASAMKTLNAAMAQEKLSLQAYQENVDVLTDRLNSAKSAFLEAGEAATHGGIGTAGFNRELIVLGHEMMQGNFSRLGGSLMVLGERMGGLSLATIGWGAAIAAAGYAVYELIDRWNTVETAVHNAEGSMVMLGTANAASEDQTRSMIDALKTQWGATNGGAAKSAQTIQTIGGAAAQYKAQILAVAAAQSQLTGSDLEKTTEQVATAFAGGAAGAMAYAEKIHALGTTIDADGQSEQSRIEAMIKGGAQSQALAAILAALEARFVSSGQATAAAKKQLEDYFRAAAAMAESGQTPESVGMQMPSQQQIKVQPGTQVQDPNQADQDAAVGKTNDAAQQRLAIETQIGLVQQAQDRGVQGAAETQMALWQQLAQVHSAAEKMAHDATMAGLQAEMIEAQGDGDKRVAIEQRIAAAVAQWSGAGSAEALAANNAVLRDKQAAETAAAKDAHDRRLAGFQEELILAKDNADQRVAIERKIAAETAGFSGANSPAALQANNQVLQAQITAADEATKAKQKAAAEQLALTLAELDGEMKAAKNNFTQEMAIEEQKLAARRAAGQQGTVEYQQELDRKAALQAQHDAQMAQAATEHANTLREIERIGLQAQSQELDAQLAAGTITNAKKVELERGLQDQLYALEVKGAQDALTLQNLSLTERQRLNDQLLVLKAQHDQAMAKLDDEAAAARKKDLDAYQADFRQALAPINSAFDGMVKGVISGNQSMSQLGAKAAQTLAEGYIDQSAKMAEKWASDRLAELVLGQTTEAAKTAATAAGTAARAAQDNQGLIGFVERIGQQLAQWLGLETGKTAATDAGITARAASDEVLAAMNVAQGFGQISIAAAVAAANAFAAYAALPPVALAASAAAYATTMGFAAGMGGGIASAAGGWDQVPNDQIAQLHKNEMVLPAGLAGRIRDMTAVPAGDPGINVPAGMSSAIAAQAASSSAGPASGAGATHFHYAPNVQAMDAAGVDRVLRNHSTTMIKHFQNLQRNGALKGRR